jgi:hypothetical protein
MAPQEIIEHVEAGSAYYTESGCLEWVGSCTPDGYGQFHSRGKTYYAHREMMRAQGHDIDGMSIDHLCERKACSNPAHLDVVTPAENTRRMRDPEWQAYLRTIRPTLGGYEPFERDAA